MTTDQCATLSTHRRGAGLPCCTLAPITGTKPSNDSPRNLCNQATCPFCCMQGLACLQSGHQGRSEPQRHQLKVVACIGGQADHCCIGSASCSRSSMMHQVQQQFHTPLSLETLMGTGVLSQYCQQIGTLQAGSRRHCVPARPLPGAAMTGNNALIGKPTESLGQSGDGSSKASEVLREGPSAAPLAASSTAAVAQQKGVLHVTCLC